MVQMNFQKKLRKTPSSHTWCHTKKLDGNGHQYSHSRPWRRVESRRVQRFAPGGTPPVRVGRILGVTHTLIEDTDTSVKTVVIRCATKKALQHRHTSLAMKFFQKWDSTIVLAVVIVRRILPVRNACSSFQLNQIGFMVSSHTEKKNYFQRLCCHQS